MNDDAWAQSKNDKFCIGTVGQFRISSLPFVQKLCSMNCLILREETNAGFTAAYESESGKQAEQYSRKNQNIVQLIPILLSKTESAWKWMNTDDLLKLKFILLR